MKKSSLDTIREFLEKKGITINPSYYLAGFIQRNGDYIDLPPDIVERIIGDAFGSNNNLIKEISNMLLKEYGLYLGRIQKNQLKLYLDYCFDKDLEIFKNLVKQELEQEIDFKGLFDEYIKSDAYSKEDQVKTYIANLNNVIEKSDKNRIQDYLLFLYSRLISFNERRLLSLRDLFNENQEIIRKELDTKDYEELKDLCNNNEKKNRDGIITKFNEEYIRILESNGGYKQKSGIIYLDIDQELFDKFESKEDFYDHLLSFMKKAYEKIQNHKSLILKVKNVISNKINIKWELYAYLTIFAERFKKEKETRTYYKPENVCIDTLEHKFGIKINEDEKKLISKYYSSNHNEDVLRSFPKFDDDEIIKTINFFKDIPVGFTFIDCIVLLTKSKHPNSEEISFIENKNELLLIFNKHKIDDRKLPCPVCGSLKISGNSYPEVGIKSWECKNPLCSARSKTNRGKRYSERTTLMQNATFDFSEQNQISKELVKIWRKDVVENWSNKDLFRMIVKYFSFVNDKITLINVKDLGLITDEINSGGRMSEPLSFDSFLQDSELDKGIFKKFFNSDFVNLFIYSKDISDGYQKDLNKIFDTADIKIIQGNSFEVLHKIGSNKIHNMVTSPPYYNAREYSQWRNLYNYLNDMYNINIKSNTSLIPGGVFFYNIGDIFDNENIIVKSKMGEKRIPLGAYTILLFKKAGFELLDNIIWYKGEPQSNRHKNDGNYTPYYQRPANCYEHMFIFKKEGELKLNNNIEENELKSNLIKFTPVFKIGNGGINRYGHTAPFPKNIPILSITCFTNKGSFILDPFSGSGTSPITAAILNRNGVGVELNEDYARLSLEKAKEHSINAVLLS